MNAIAEVFYALGDPLRLEMVQRLARRHPSTIAVLTEGLGISRQGARKHLQVLVDAKLVVLAPSGREVHVDIELAAIGRAKVFISQLESRWELRLDALRRAVEKRETLRG